jgi:cysteine desulfurase
MRIYLDHNATTPLRPEVAEAMARAMRDLYGNPSSAHAEGARARAAVEQAREQVAALVGARPAEIVFTSGATEANHLAIHGVARRRVAQPPGSLVASAVEHPSVDAPLVVLEGEGFAVARVPVDGEGRLDLAALDEALDAGPTLCSCIWAQNETGVVAPVDGVADRCRARGVPLHLDATQAVGKLPVRLDRVPADLLSASGHKLNGPKGVGFLVVRSGRELAPWLRGGGQERGRRGGTVNAPGIVGLGVAALLAAADLAARGEAASALRDRLWDGIAAKVPRVRRNGEGAPSLPNTLNVEFADAPADVLVEALDGEGIAASAGAACASGAVHASAALLAMGRTPAQARSAVRFSVGLGNDEAQIDRVVALLPDLVARVRAAGAEPRA